MFVLGLAFLLLLLLLHLLVTFCSIVIPLEARLVRVTAEQIDDGAVIAAVYQAGYEAVKHEKRGRRFTPGRYRR